MRTTLELVKTAYTTEQLPSFDLPQIAMAGRSNVGKSSLLNALAGRKSLAKVSANPGKTRSVNFYLVEPWQFYLIDLPGYGYARASHEERRQWARVLETYLSHTKELRGLALLLDCRLTPQKIDRELAVYAMNINLPVIPVLTKADKCKQKERQTRQNEWRDILGQTPLLVSAQRKSGLNKLWRALILCATGKVVEGEVMEY
ncbi:MAG: ribosome biogenesis GTP-binding protein YihA/YsxC [Desulfovibrio sp.]|nr:ribosome biogenesis GTP-binding protein YihA/YsxC [Desulfovibrio sp.]